MAQSNGRHNNSFNRSEVSLDFIVNLSHDAVVSCPVNSGVMLSLPESQQLQNSVLPCIFIVDTKGRFVMKVQIQKWGNSLALRIPKSFAAESKVEQGSVVEVSLEQGKIIVAPVAEAEFTLADLLAKVTKQNLHEEVNTGVSRGKEGWKWITFLIAA